MKTASTPSRIGITVARPRASSRWLSSAPSPVDTRIDASVTVSEYVGIAEEPRSRWIIVISKNMKPSPSAAKYTAEVPFAGSARHCRRTTKNGSSRNTAA